MKILIVEDDHTSLEMMRNILKKFGKCDAAVDGKEAVHAFNVAWEEDKPYDLICLDVMMPNLNGKEALKMIREMEGRMEIQPDQKVKIVMTTALGDLDIIYSAGQLGADSYIVKPITVTKLSEEIEKLFPEEEEEKE